MKKVLILEDEVNIRSFVVINLKRAGYDAIEAGTGQEALDRLAENPDIGVAILAKQLDASESMGDNLVRTMELSVNPYVGSNFDAYV